METSLAQADSESKENEAGTDSGTLDEVVVSARKREETLQTVPVAVSVVSKQMIQDLHLPQLNDIDQLAPNVQIVSLQASTTNAPRATIRGIGQREPDTAADPVVPVVVDGFIYSRTVGSLIGLWDVEQIEILRGPQGSLFGGNTIGGVINVRSKKPSGEFGGEFGVTVGQHGRMDMDGAIDLPIIDETLSARVSFIHATSDGYFTNLIDDTDFGGEDLWAGRSKVLWTPNDAFEAMLTVSYVHDRGDAAAFNNFCFDGYIVCDAGFPGTTPDGVALTDAPYDIYNSPAPDENFSDELGTVLRMTYDAGWGVFTSITGYRDTEENFNADVDGTPLIILDTPRATDTLQKSQELRLAMQPTENLDVMLGVYYNDFRYATTDDWRFAPGFVLSGFTSQSYETLALFAQGVYNIGDSWRVTAGFRYSEEEKDFFRIPVGVPTQVSDTQDWDQLTPEFGVDYIFPSGSMVYFKYTEGFHSGGYNGRANNASTIGPYNEESVEAYEMGLKALWFEDRLRLSMATFSMNYTDLQLTGVRASAGGAGFDTFIENAGEVTNNGLEIELTYRVTDNFVVNFAQGYLDAQYDKFETDFGNDGTLDDGSDLALVDSPEWTSNLNLQWELPFSGDFVVRVVGNINYASEVETELQNLPVGHRDAQTMVDASITLADIDDRYRFTLWGKNLTEELYVEQVFPVSPFTNFGRFNPPRTVGLNFRYNF